ncbi:iron-sulfur cluster co-chaperone protein HscB-like [Antedon mediterranea]|uniref:iron-sulfur cluster co-chaperone protein HscB-like n=1 Tax=Antedon mediterranea TaxID=105859 RepID=UPI003AF5C6E2
MAAPMVMFRIQSSKFVLRQCFVKFKCILPKPSNVHIIEVNKICNFRAFSSLCNYKYRVRMLDGSPGPEIFLKTGDHVATKAISSARFGSGMCKVIGPKHLVGYDTCSPIRFCHTSSICWNCLASNSHPEIGVNFFCESCKMIQPCQENIDYFQRMSLLKSFDIDTKELTQTFRNFQRLLHPDKFSQKSPKEQEFSAGQSSAVNKAYSTLLKPLNRGLYLLELLGHPIEEGDSMVDKVFLMDMMELNEELSDTTNLEIVKKIGEENELNIKELMIQLAELFKNDQLKEARDVLAKLKYYTNIDDKVKEKLGTSTV